MILMVCKISNFGSSGEAGHRRGAETCFVKVVDVVLVRVRMTETKLVLLMVGAMMFL
jgi:hypothetical protein